MPSATLPDLSDRPIGSLTLKEIGRNLFWALLWMGTLLLICRRFINYNEEEIIDWEAWGDAGLWIAGVAVVAGLWLAYG